MDAVPHYTFGFKIKTAKRGVFMGLEMFVGKIIYNNHGAYSGRPYRIVPVLSIAPYLANMKVVQSLTVT